MRPARRATTLATALVVSAIAFVASGDAPASAQTPTATLVKVIRTSGWSRPSPDPSGLTYLRATGHLFVSDSEVEETRLYRGSDVWEMRKDGRVARSFGVTRFTNEPSGIAVKPHDRSTIYYSDDDHDRVSIVRWGPDHRWGTRDDDLVRAISTTAFSCRDPEGIAYGRTSLFLSSGAQQKIFRVRPGKNGVFDGVVRGDDVVTRFDVGGAGMGDPEGVEYDPATGHLLVVSANDEEIAEVTLSGDLVNRIDISSSGIRNPAGITILPRPSGRDSTRVYVADRGLDNGSHPRENDGKIYVFRVTWR
jgi:DNA-binding beta-propeller fold protein YncE